MVAPVIAPALVGRVSEATALRSAFERACEGQPVTVLVSGEAGIGKSRLVTTVLPDLPGDPLVVVGHCLELGAEGAPYVPFVAIARNLLRRLGREEMAKLLPEGSALADWLPELGPAPAHYVRTRLLGEVLALVSGVAQARPVALVVEDLHWADAASRELFAYLARNLAGSAVLLVGTVRTGALAPSHPNRQLLAELGRRSEVVRIALDALDQRRVAELLTAIDGRPPDPSRSRRIHRRSGGNPLFVEALSGAGEAPDGDLQALLLNRIGDLSEPARELLSALAVGGADTEIDAVSGALQELVERGLVVVDFDGYRIRHDLIRETVYGALLPSDRRRLHARCARALAARDVDSVALAEHWSAAGEYEKALPAAWRAAARAGRQHAYDEQLHLLELIVAQWIPGLLRVDRAVVLEQAATAAFAAGKSASGVAHSSAALDELDPSAEPDRAARLLSLRGQLQTRIDSTGWKDLERSIALVPPGSSDALRSRLLSVLGFVGVGGHRYDDSRRYAGEALSIADRLDDDGLRAPALLVLAMLDGAAGDVEQGGQRFARARSIAEAIGDEHTYLTTYQWESLMLGNSGRYEQAAELARAGQQAAERLGRARARGSMLAVARSMHLRFLGRWDEALEVVDDALADEPPPLYAASLRIAAADIARCRGETDRFETLLRQLTEFAQRARTAQEAKAEIVVQRIAWAIDQGDLERANLVLAELLAPAPPSWMPSDAMRLAVIEARLHRARRAAAPRNRRVADEVAARSAALLRLVNTLPSLTPALIASRLTVEATVASDDLPAWDRAAAAWRELGNRYETAMVLIDAASAALASNNRPGAQSRLREARAIATELGAAPLLMRVGELVLRGRLAGDENTLVHNDFGLTRRELDVLRVLARGRSNPQIAAELFISNNTVATHVARILTKLGAATRTEAATRAHDAGLLDP